MPTHLFATMSITAVAAGLGGLAEHLGGDLPLALVPWLLAAVVAWQIAYGVRWDALTRVDPEAVRD
jgi:hypothetical protein